MQTACQCGLSSFTCSSSRYSIRRRTALGRVSMKPLLLPTSLCSSSCARGGAQPRRERCTCTDRPRPWKLAAGTAIGGVQMLSDHQALFLHRQHGEEQLLVVCRRRLLSDVVCDVCALQPCCAVVTVTASRVGEGVPRRESSNKPASLPLERDCLRPSLPVTAGPPLRMHASDSRLWNERQCVIIHAHWKQAKLPKGRCCDPPTCVQADSRTQCCVLGIDMLDSLIVCRRRTTHAACLCKILLAVFGSLFDDAGCARWILLALAMHGHVTGI